MKAHLLILFFILLIGVCSNEQVNDPVKTFYTHTSTCHFIGTTEEHYVIELFPDSLVKISKYATSYMDEYNSIMRTTFLGVYTINHDTVRIKYLSHNTEVKNKKVPKLPVAYTKPLNDFVLYPSSIFLLKNNKTLAGDYLYEEVPASSHSVAAQLNTKFQNWGFKNYREIFGISK
jgi:hypothetical protein